MHPNYGEQKNFQNMQKPKENLVKNIKKSKRKLVIPNEEEKTANNSKNQNNCKFPKIYEEDKKNQLNKVNEKLRNDHNEEKKEYSSNVIHKFERFSKGLLFPKEDFQSEFKNKETLPKIEDLTNKLEIDKTIELLKNENEKLLVVYYLFRKTMI